MKVQGAAFVHASGEWHACSRVWAMVDVGARRSWLVAGSCQAALNAHLHSMVVADLPASVRSTPSGDHSRRLYAPSIACMLRRQRGCRAHGARVGEQDEVDALLLCGLGARIEVDEGTVGAVRLREPAASVKHRSGRFGLQSFCLCDRARAGMLAIWEAQRYRERCIDEGEALAACRAERRIVMPGDEVLPACFGARRVEVAQNDDLRKTRELSLCASDGERNAPVALRPLLPASAYSTALPVSPCSERSCLTLRALSGPCGRSGS